jgi:hypothetical protein
VNARWALCSGLYKNSQQTSGFGLEYISNLIVKSASLEHQPPQVPVDAQHIAQGKRCAKGERLVVEVKHFGRRVVFECVSYPRKL